MCFFLFINVVRLKSILSLNRKKEVAHVFVTFILVYCNILMPTCMY